MDVTGSSFDDYGFGCGHSLDLLRRIIDRAGRFPNLMTIWWGSATGQPHRCGEGHCQPPSGKLRSLFHGELDGRDAPVLSKPPNTLQQRPRATEVIRNLLFARPPVLSAARVNEKEQQDSCTHR